MKKEERKNNLLFEVVERGEREIEVLNNETQFVYEINRRGDGTT